MSTITTQPKPLSTHADTAAAVPPGFKRTEVGVIPGDWSVRRLGEQATFRTGPFGSALHKSDYTDDGVPVINPMHIIDGQLVPTRTMTVTEHAAKQLVDFRLRSGDIIIGRRGDMGRCAVVQESQDGWLCGTGSLIIRCAEGVAPDFVQRVLSSPRAVTAIEDASVGSTMINLNQGVLAGLRIPCPPRDEQRAIAAALSDVDGLIGTLDKLIAKKQAIKQAAMHQLLTGKTPLPGFEGKWRLVPLMNKVPSTRFAIVDGPFGSQMKVGEFVNSGIPIIEMEHLKDTYIDPNVVERYISATKFEELKRSAVYPGDIVISKTGSLGYLGLIPNGIKEGMITSRLAKISLDRSRADRMFVFQYLLKMRVDGYWEKVSQGGTMQILSIHMLQNAPVPDISLDEQTAIATVLSDMDAEIAALERRRDKTKAIKRGMMQVLLTGRVRLVKPGATA